MTQTPYARQPPRAFWRTGVASADLMEASDLYRKKFPIAPKDRISSAGSCFAQHISRKLANAGYNFRDFEPAPGLLPADRRSSFGYGLFSARYGNIYTARQLRQLIERAYGEFAPDETVWRHHGRYFDPFRPTIEPDGFHSQEEFDATQGSHFAAVRKMCETTDVFIFTFGLTEAWQSKSDGAVYPICPGTVAGVFDPSKYAFVNFTHSSVLADMEAVIVRLRRYKPDMRFLFTVSPVPLTATASDDHVLTATTYSKSVLRGVAGELAQRHPFVDYFPSYEIIASAPSRGVFFEPNMRSVTPAGVDHVMSHFFSEHVPSPNRKSKTTEEEEPDADELLCDEELLDRETA